MKSKFNKNKVNSFFVQPKIMNDDRKNFKFMKSEFHKNKVNSYFVQQKII